MFIVNSNYHLKTTKNQISNFAVSSEEIIGSSSQVPNIDKEDSNHSICQQTSRSSRIPYLD